MIAIAFSGSEDGIRRNDKEMVDHYNQIRIDLHELNSELLPLAEKGLEKIDDSWTKPDPVSAVGITQEKLKELRIRLLDLSIPRGFYSGKGTIRYITYASGMVTGGSGQGYLFSKEEPRNYYKDNSMLPLEPYRVGEEKVYPKGGSFTIWTEIEENWYYYEKYDD